MTNAMLCQICNKELVNFQAMWLLDYYILSITVLWPSTAQLYMPPFFT